VRKESILVPAIVALGFVLFATVLIVFFALSRIGRRVDRIADQMSEHVEHARQLFAAKQPPEKQV